jgi:uncharacterized iron-regulated membrane protein
VFSFIAITIAFSAPPRWKNHRPRATPSPTTAATASTTVETLAAVIGVVLPVMAFGHVLDLGVVLGTLLSEMKDATDSE